MNQRYAILTVDTEALPNRAPGDHIKRLMWGEHEQGTAGVREMATVAAEFGARLTYFLDMCGAWEYREELAQVARWLARHGEDVQLHVHPEYLPATFWEEHGLPPKPAYLNTYKDERAEFIISFFSKLLHSFTGEAPKAFRAGSFRWNAGTLRALHNQGIALSFNNSMCAVYNKQCLFSLPTNTPYQWENGIVEIPMTEHQIFPRVQEDWWARLQYPQSRFFRLRPRWASCLPGSVQWQTPLLVFLLHSWSFLYRDEQGYEVYRDDRLLCGYRKFVRALSKNYDIVTSKELLGLVQLGKIPLSHVQSLAPAEFSSNAAKRP